MFELAHRHPQMEARRDVGPKIELEHKITMLHWNADGLGDE